jgi:flagellar basal-body rod protein FlgC
VFAEQLDRSSGLSTVNVSGVMRSSAAPIKQHDPDHPLADAEGNVWTAPVDENAEMVEMLDASRQYQNLVEALSTAKQLMLETMRMK